MLARMWMGPCREFGPVGLLAFCLLACPSPRLPKACPPARPLARPSAREDIPSVHSLACPLIRSLACSLAPGGDSPTSPAGLGQLATSLSAYSFARSSIRSTSPQQDIPPVCSRAQVRSSTRSLARLPPARLPKARPPARPLTRSSAQEDKPSAREDIPLCPLAHLRARPLARLPTPLPACSRSVRLLVRSLVRLLDIPSRGHPPRPLARLSA